MWTGAPWAPGKRALAVTALDRKSTRLNSKSRLHLVCRLLLEKKKKPHDQLLSSAIRPHESPVEQPYHFAQSSQAKHACDGRALRHFSTADARRGVSPAERVH